MQLTKHMPNYYGLSGIVMNLHVVPSFSHSTCVEYLVQCVCARSVWATMEIEHQQLQSKLNESAINPVLHAACACPLQARMLLAIGEANSQHRGRENKAKALEAAANPPNASVSIHCFFFIISSKTSLMWGVGNGILNSNWNSCGLRCDWIG